MVGCNIVQPSEKIRKHTVNTQYVRQLHSQYITERDYSNNKISWTQHGI